MSHKYAALLWASLGAKGIALGLHGAGMIGVLAGMMLISVGAMCWAGVLEHD